MPALFLLLVCLAQIPVQVICPAGAYSITTPGPTSITYTATSVTFSWGALPPAPPPTPPTPPIPPTPIADQGLRVLILYESGEISKYPPAQIKIIYDQALRTFLDQTTVMGEDGKTHEYRIWDEHTPLVSVAQRWKDAMARAHPQMPWIVISNGVTGYEGPLPANTTDTIALIQKYVVP